MPENEIARRTIDAAELDNLADQDIDMVLAIIMGEVQLAENDPGAVEREIARRTLAGETIDEILGDDGGVRGTKDFLGRVITVNDFTIRPSNLAEGKGIYFLVDVIDKGESTLMSTSSTRIMAQLATLKMRNLLPLPVSVSSDTTAGGFTVYKLSHAVRI